MVANADTVFGPDAGNRMGDKRKLNAGIAKPAADKLADI